jgi:hypothetical protein
MQVRLNTLRRFRAPLAIVCLGLILASSAWAASSTVGRRGNYRGQCRRLTVQLEHYQGTILPMAISRGNRGWEAATAAQIDRLWHRRADLCPAYGEQRTLLAKAADQMRQFNDMVKLAGRAALTYFTGGLTGGLGP